YESMLYAFMVRSSPFLMPTMAALVGTLPIALGYGAGGESRQPLGLAVVGGLLVSQLLTLYITPVYYVYIESARLWVEGRHHARALQPVAARPAAHAAAEPPPRLPMIDRGRETA